MQASSISSPLSNGADECQHDLAIRHASNDVNEGQVLTLCFVRSNGRKVSGYCLSDG
jgi:hypothetical protein